MDEVSGLDMWTIYDHPTDYPDHFVARRWVITAKGEMPTQDVLKYDSLDVLREIMDSYGLVKLARNIEDDPAIIETWL